MCLPHNPYIIYHSSGSHRLVLACESPFIHPFVRSGLFQTIAHIFPDKEIILKSLFVLKIVNIQKSILPWNSQHDMTSLKVDITKKASRVHHVGTNDSGIISFRHLCTFRSSSKEKCKWRVIFQFHTPLASFSTIEIGLQLYERTG